MSNEIIYLTAEGMNKLKEELHHMVSVERPQAAQAIAEARDEITNGVAEWEYTDYIPERLYKVHKWFDRNYKDWGMDGYLIMNMILFFPMLICYYKNKTKPYFPIVMFVTAMIFAKFVMKWNILSLIFIK